MKRKKGEADESFNVFGDGEVEEFGDEKVLDGEDGDLYDDDEDEDDDEFGEEDSDFDEDIDGEDDLDIEEESLDGLVDDDE